MANRYETRAHELLLRGDEFRRYVQLSRMASGTESKPICADCSQTDSSGFASRQTTSRSRPMAQTLIVIHSEAEQASVAAKYPMGPAPLCGERSADDAFGCTRSRHQDGMHVAHGAQWGKAVAVWSDSNQPTGSR